MSYVLTTLLKDKIKSIDHDLVELREQQREFRIAISDSPTREDEADLRERYGYADGAANALIMFKNYLSDLASAIELDERI